MSLICLISTVAWFNSAQGETLPKSIQEMVLKDIGFYKPVEGPTTPVLARFLISYGYITNMGPTEKLKKLGPYLREDRGVIGGIYTGGGSIFYLTLAKRVLKHIDYANKWKLNNLDTWSFTFTYFMEPTLPELPQRGPFTGKGTAMFNPATGKFDTVTVLEVGLRYGSSLGDRGGFEYYEWLEKQPIPQTESLQFSTQTPSQQSKKTTISSLTKNLPYKLYALPVNRGGSNISFDDAWEAVNKAILKQRETITTSDRNKGIIIAEGHDSDIKHWSAVLIEKDMDNSILINVQAIAYKNGENVNFSNSVSELLQKNIWKEIHEKQDSSKSANQTFLSPVVNFRFSANPPNDYATFNLVGNKKYHTGIDIISDQHSLTDTPIYVIADGTVENICRTNDTDKYCDGTPLDITSISTANHGYGNTVIVKHDNGLYSLYGHLDGIEKSIKKGAKIKQGQKIGKMGNSAYEKRESSFGKHLHFETRKFGTLHSSDKKGNYYWGYTLEHPDELGYLNPKKYIGQISDKTS